MTFPDPSTLSLPELRALDAALRAALAALQAGGPVSASLLADPDGFAVVLFFEVPDDPSSRSPRRGRSPSGA